MHVKNPSSLISILIAEDHEVMGFALEQALQEQPGFTVVGRVKDGLQALEKVKALRPKVAVLDIGLPGLNGLECTKRMAEESPYTAVVGLSMHLKEEFVLGMLRAGAMGYVVKSSDFSELVACINQAAQGSAYFCHQVSGMVLELLRGNGTRTGELTSILTSREKEVLQLIAEGFTNKQIAAMLHLSHKTVESHRAQIIDKLGIRDVANLTKYAIREGLTSAE